MTRQREVRTDPIDVELFMADVDPPALYDFFLTRTGSLRRSPASRPVGGLMQVVLAGPHPPSNRQMLTLKRNFELYRHFRVMKFF